jgi:hypothetical protein
VSSPRTAPIHLTKRELKYVRRMLAIDYERMSGFRGVPAVAARMRWHAAVMDKLDAALTPPSLVPAPTTNQRDADG